MICVRPKVVVSRPVLATNVLRVDVFMLEARAWNAKGGRPATPHTFRAKDQHQKWRASCRILVKSRME